MAITLGTLTSYQYAVHQGFDEPLPRSMTFATLIAANLCLTMANRSFYFSILTTLTYKNNLVVFILCLTISIVGLLFYVPSLARFFQFTPLTIGPLAISVGLGFGAVLWYEAVKWWKRVKMAKTTA